MGVFRYVVICGGGKVSGKIKIVKLCSGGWCCEQLHRAPGDIALLPNTKNHISYEQNLWLLWMRVNPVNRWLVGGGKRDFSGLLFSPTVTPRAHVVLVQEEHRAPRGLKLMVLSIK